VGLETIVGPRYLTVLPGRGPRQRFFVGLERPPIVESVQPGDLEVIVRSPRQGGLQAGGPVFYRQVRIGWIMSVGLTSDAGAVEARLYIDGAYAQLIRQGTCFWRMGGIKAHIGFSGVEVDVDSLPTLITGGIGVATPPIPEAGEVVRTGHRFELADEPDPEWLGWEPLIAIGSSLLPPGAILPDCRRAKLAWREGFLFPGSRSIQGWVLFTERGLLGPLDLLQPSEDAKEGSIALEVAGREIPIDAAPSWTADGIALLDAARPPEVATWPRERERRPEEVEDCLAIGDPNAAALPIAASRLTRGEIGWDIDAAIPIDRSWHGAPVLARSDGYLVGLLLVDVESAHVAWVAE
jgi:hypothetical protein